MNTAFEDLVPEFEAFLKKLGIGRKTILDYKGCFRAMLKLLNDRGMDFKDVDAPSFQEEYFAKDRQGRRLRFNNIRKFLCIKGFFDCEAGVSAGTCGLEEARQAYFAELRRRGLKESTIKGAECDTRKFMRYCGEQGVQELDGLKRRIVEGFVTHLFVAEDSGYCLNKKTIILYYLKDFLAYLFESGRTIINPGIYIEVPRRERKISRNYLKREEIVRLFSRVNTDTVLGFMDRTMFEVLYGTGMRVGELCNLTTGDVDLENESILIRQGKGGTDRVVPLTEAARKYLQAYLDNVRPRILRMMGKSCKEQMGYLFLNVYGARPCERTVSMIITRYLADAGVGKRRSAHALRHACATHLLENGADIRYIAELLGHRKLDTTGAYTRVSIRNLLEAVRLHPRAAGQEAKFKEARKRGY